MYFTLEFKHLLKARKHLNNALKCLLHRNLNISIFYGRLSIAAGLAVTRGSRLPGTGGAARSLLPATVLPPQGRGPPLPHENMHNLSKIYFLASTPFFMLRAEPKRHL